MRFYLDYDKLTSLSRDHPVCVVFVDRFSEGGYTYHPLRRGRFVLTREADGYMYFRVRLDKFVYPRDPNAFNAAFQTHLCPCGVPQLTGADPRNAQDGYYAVVNESLFSQTEDFHLGESAWSKCVEALETCQSFSGECLDKNFVFTRCVIRDARKKVPIAPQLVRDLATFYLTKGSKYELELSYRYPAQVTDPDSVATVRCVTGDNFKGLPADEINIESCNNSTCYRFTTKRYLEDDTDSLSLSFQASDSEVEVLGTDSKLEMRIREPLSFRVQVILAILICAILNVFIGADLNDAESKSWLHAAGALWPKLLAGFLQAAVLIRLSKLVGKKLF